MIHVYFDAKSCLLNNRCFIHSETGFYVIANASIEGLRPCCFLWLLSCIPTHSNLSKFIREATSSPPGGSTLIVLQSLNGTHLVLSLPVFQNCTKIFSFHHLRYFYKNYPQFVIFFKVFVMCWTVCYCVPV